MIPFDQMPYNPIAERLVEILCKKTQNNNPTFFRVLVGYYFSQVASMMRTQVATHDRGDIPVNMYALNLATSGSGKGYSMNIMENDVLKNFNKRFKNETFPSLAQDHLPILAVERATRKGSDPDSELESVTKEFERLGNVAFTFDSATPPAVKQLRHKLLMAKAGSMSLQIDEIGSNLIGSVDVLTTFLELYDVGAIKEKLTKNTAESIRGEEIMGRTPCNMLMFGTPAKLLNGGKIEEELYSMLETGYARRCLFGFSTSSTKNLNMTPEEVFAQLTDKTDDQFLNKLALDLENLADVINANKRLIMDKDISLKLIEYRLMCERYAETLPEHEEIRKAEISHRYFKALKLAGAYAFIDNSIEVCEEHLYQAIRLVEESGENFSQLLTRDRPYVKLAKYISSIPGEVTQADLVEDLPFYKGASAQKSEMMSLAIAYGYKNNIIIKRSIVDGIEFLRGETLKRSDITKCILAYSQDITTGYRNEYAPFDKLHQLTQATNLHWVSHHLIDGYRSEEKAIPGFNLVVIDVDKGVDVAIAQELLKDYKYMIYTTKRHTATEHRFRIIFPINYELKLDAKDYKEFMSNICDWLPFEVDRGTIQRARKWLTNDQGTYVYNDGEILDALPFIPKTSKNEERKATLQSQTQMDNLERWVINNAGDGNRNNMLLRYGMILLDAGFQFDAIRQKVLDMNSKLPDKLEEAEIMSTIMVSILKRKQTP